jgi:xylulose-5-phosphate/fructose-6-phosphate phosphoketolase
VQLMNEHFPAVKIRLVNVVDLATLQPPHAHPNGLDDAAFDALFTTDKPVIFAYHGYPTLIHRLTYRRTNHANIHVHGFREEGTTTTPFDMAVLNGIDRYHLFAAVVHRLPQLSQHHGRVAAIVAARLDEHRRYIREHGIDMPEVLHWRWRGNAAPGG